jgi:hypothetical protein
MSDEKKTKYLEKQQMAHHLKKVATFSNNSEKSRSSGEGW